tara:strand:- start:455 stop:1312 length:858 start_codon:yes stop_codon:yes gene_type:complete
MVKNSEDLTLVTKKVSVVIPCYNQGIYLNEAIQSIQEQTYKNYEIIVVNDGSNDEQSKEIINKLQRRNIRIFNKENGGLSNARNYGIKRSRGDYILPLDSDDKFEKTFLDKSVKILNENKDIGVVTCGVGLFGIKKGSYYPTGGNLKNFLIKNQACGNSLFRKQCWEEVGGYNEKMKEGMEDWDFWLSITEKGWVVYVIPEILFWWRKTKNSMSERTRINHSKIFIKMIKFHEKTYADNFSYFIDKYEDQKNKELRRVYNSRSYKLGNLILFPLKIIKNLLQFED